MSDIAKRNAAQAALDLVQPDMVLGLGTGSTAAIFVRLLAERVSQGLKVVGTPTSEATDRLARSLGVRIVSPDDLERIDLTIDGADEFDPDLNLIKGGGAALLREKIVACAARRFVVIADASKKVAELGRFPLAVEIEPFAFALTIRAMRDALARAGWENARVSLRAEPGGGFARSDGGHFIADCALGRIGDARAVDAALKAIPGVIETGLFVGVADEAFIAAPDGVVRLTRR